MKNILKWILLSVSILTIGTWLYAQTPVIGIPWELRGINVYIGTQATGQVFFRNGTAALPAISFIGDTTTGLFWNIGNANVEIARTGNRWYSFGQDDFFILSNSARINMGGAQDVIIGRDGPNILFQKNGNADQTQRWYGANGAYFQIKTQSELLTILSAAFTDTAMSIPANAVVRGVAVYVVTVIPTAATFTVTGATSTTVFNTAAVGTGAGSNDVGDQNTPYKNGAAQLIRITPNLVPLAATGQVRIVLMYEIPSAPTS